MTNKQIAQAFAEGATKGKNSLGSMFIEGNRIYSYGYHFIIAERASDKVAKVTTRKYSVTTSKQTGLVASRLAMAGYTLEDAELMPEHLINAKPKTINA